MISYPVYKVIHMIGVFMVFLSLGGLMVFSAVSTAKKHPWRKMSAMTHGIGMLFLLVGGFGVLARLGMHSLPTWVVIKLLIWVLFGAVMMLIRKKPEFNKVLWFALIALGAVAAYLGNQKPF